MVSNKKTEKDTTKGWMYPACAITYVLAMLSSNSALQYVSYPTQVIGKSIKPVPVLIFGVLFAGKRYPKLKYLAILMVVMGNFSENFKKLHSNFVYFLKHLKFLQCLKRVVSGISIT